MMTFDALELMETAETLVEWPWEMVITPGLSGEIGRRTFKKLANGMIVEGKPVFRPCMGTEWTLTRYDGDVEPCGEGRIEDFETLDDFFDHIRGIITSHSQPIRK